MAPERPNGTVWVIPSCSHLNLRLDPVAEDLHISGLAFRAAAVLPVLFD
jgi:hypothetical protein